MTMEEPQVPPEPQPQPQPEEIATISPEQWQAFIGNIQQQTQALQNEALAAKSELANRTRHDYQAQIAALPDKERADALQAQLQQIEQTAQAAQAQQISTSVWQRRDAEAASRLLQLHGFNGQEPELYRGNWDVNWMPRFV